MDVDNFTNLSASADVGNETLARCQRLPLDIKTIVFVITYTIIFLVGLFGNLLVIAVILKYDNLKTVTNHYILNLSIADSLFLAALPMLITVALAKAWIFGSVLCKVYYALDCINKFTSAFTITVMASDRYIAACHPIKSLQYRKPKHARLVLLITWLLSLVVMSPAIIFAQLDQCQRCVIIWSSDGAHQNIYSRLFFAYTLVLAFLLPVIIISVSYSKIIMKLRKGGHADSAHRRHCQFRKATRLVTLVICVFIVCWLPYWIVQVLLLIAPTTITKNLFIYQAATFLSYTNSMLNPLLYAFTNDGFREAFSSAAKCSPVVSSHDHRDANCFDKTGRICRQIETAVGAHSHATTASEVIHLNSLKH